MKRILQNSFGKTILCLLVALLSGGSAWAQEAYRTIDFANCDRSQYATNHGTPWTATNTSENFRVTLTNFNNAERANGGYWDYIACGRRSNAVIATITTGLIDKPITTVDLTKDITTTFNVDYINSISLYISSDYQNWGEPVGTFSHGDGESSATIPENKRAANLFYRIEVDCDGSLAYVGSTNFVHISKVVFNKAADDPNAVKAPTITGNPEPTFPTQTLVTISRPDGAESVQYSTDGGTTWQTFTSASTTFALTKTTTVKAKAKKGNKESEEVSKCFSHAADVVDCTWNLKAAPTGGTPTANQALWTDDAEGNHTGAVMTLAKGGSSTNVNAHIGNNNDGTYFYSGQKLTVSPVEGYTIVSVEFTCGNNYSDELEGCVWSNATISRAGTKVTVTPIDGTQPITMIVSAETHVTSVTVHYSPTEQPYIEVAEHEKNVSSASSEGTIELEYHGYFVHDVKAVKAYDTNGEATWITVSLNGDGNVAYSIDANTTTEQRVAIIHVQTARTDNEITVTQAAAYVLADGENADNTTLISDHNGEKCSVVLSGRTFAKDKWYTLCLPFNVDLNAEGCPLAGADARMLNDQTHIEGHTLKLEFTNVSELVAGTPYIIRWTSNDFETISSPAFADVTISSVTNDTEYGLEGGRTITFMGTYKFTKYGAVDQSILFISSNKFYYVGENTTIGAQRGYFKLGGFIYNGTGSTSTGVKEFGITLLDEDPTGIEEFKFEENSNDAIYNLSGQRINKMQKGINIVNGKKIMVK